MRGQTRGVVDGLVLAHQCHCDAGGYAAQRTLIGRHVDEVPRSTVGERCLEREALVVGGWGGECAYPADVLRHCVVWWVVLLRQRLVVARVRWLPGLCPAQLFFALIMSHSSHPPTTHPNSLHICFFSLL